MNLKENRILQNQFTGFTHPGLKDSSTTTQSWPSNRTFQEDTELFKTRLPNMQEELRKHRKIKKLRSGGDWLYQIFTHTIKPLQLKQDGTARRMDKYTDRIDSLDIDLSTRVCVLVTQLCPTLCDPMNHSPPGFSVHGILQARILEWIAILSSRGSSQPRD